MLQGRDNLVATLKERQPCCKAETTLLQGVNNLVARMTIRVSLREPHISELAGDLIVSVSSVNSDFVIIHEQCFLPLPRLWSTWGEGIFIA